MGLARYWPHRAGVVTDFIIAILLEASEWTNAGGRVRTREPEDARTVIS